VLQLGPVTMTEMMCSGDPRGVERSVLAVVQQGDVAYEIDGDRLNLTRGDRGLTYRTA
jgi:heat shock protein HslJ